MSLILLTFSLPLSLKTVMPFMNFRSILRAITSYKVLIDVFLCYFYPLEIAVMLSQITVINRSHTKQTGFIFSSKWSTEEIWDLLCCDIG